MQNADVAGRVCVCNYATKPKGFVVLVAINAIKPVRVGILVEKEKAIGFERRRCGILSARCQKF
ncbi:hypothetical protein [Flexibacter flexilis]|uniref:hypothetical protein n=1 Tax=Flexibacter flexilis TaxID=998 RepID=UPI000B862B14|nr:hypothetical protein [Flexibacter flexilis]